MKPFTFYGGPRDGEELSRTLWRNDYVIIEIDHAGGNVLSYYYERCDEHRVFEFAGEVEDDCE